MQNDPRQLNLKGRLQFLLRDSAIYGGAGAISKLFALFTFPIMARYFSVEDYGIIDAFTVLSSLLVTVLVFGQDSAVARFFYEFEETPERKKVISQSLSIQLIVIIVSMPAMLLFAGQISEYYTNQKNLQDLAVLVIWQVPFGLLINFSGNILKWTFKRFRFLFLQLGSVIVYVAAVIVAILYFHVGVKEVFQLFLISRIIFGIIGLIFIFSWLTTNFGLNHYRSLIQYGTPYGVICIIGALLPALDRFFINRYLSLQDLGVYAVAYKIAFLIQLPIDAFQMAWGPFFLSLFKEKDATKTYNAVLLIFTIVISTIGLMITMFSKQIIILFAGEKYLSSFPVVFPLVMGLIIMSIGWILNVGIDLSKKSQLKLISNFLRLVVTILIMYLLVKPLGLIGIGIGFFTGHLINTITETFLAARAYHFGYNIINPILIIFAVLLFGMLSLIFSPENILYQIIFNVSLLFGFLFFLWLIPLHRPTNLTMIK